jgi:hypothetical protein
LFTYPQKPWVIEGVELLVYRPQSIPVNGQFAVPIVLEQELVTWVSATVPEIEAILRIHCTPFVLVR